MSYETVRLAHIACAMSTAALLVLRFALALRGRDYRTMGALRWLPHAVDTVLLSAAVFLAWRSAQYPFVQPWLTAKVLALPCYIIAAAVALDPARSTRVRLAGGAASLVLLGYILAVANARSPWPFPL